MGNSFPKTNFPSPKLSMTSHDLLLLNSDGSKEKDFYQLNFQKHMHIWFKGK